MIIVTGATGHLGRLIVERLVKRVSAAQVGTSVRDPAKAARFAAMGVRVRQGDFEAPESLTEAFEGADQVLIVSSNARSVGSDPLAQHRSAIAAARAVGARRIVYTSHMAASASSAFPPMWDHWATEDMLRKSGLAWTALRNGFYAESGLNLMGDALQTGIIETPADGKVAWTAHSDLAEAAAIVLSEEGRFDGPTPALTGSETLDLDDLAGVASAVLDRPVERAVISDEAMATRMAGRGAPESAIKTVLGLYRASRGGEFNRTNPTLKRLIGRRPALIRAAMMERVGPSR